MVRRDGPDLQAEPGGEMIATIPMAVWLKALLVHSASWGSAGETLSAVLKTDENARQFKEYITRLLGYGVAQPERVRECTAERVTALSGGRLAVDKAHIHRFPLPSSLSGRAGRKRLVVTLATMTPGLLTWRSAGMMPDQASCPGCGATWKRSRRLVSGKHTPSASREAAKPATARV